MGTHETKLNSVTLYYIQFRQKEEFGRVLEVAKLVDKKPPPEKVDSESDISLIVSKVVSKNGYRFSNSLKNIGLQHCHSVVFSTRTEAIDLAKVVDKIG